MIMIYLKKLKICENCNIMLPMTKGRIFFMPNFAIF